MKKMTLITLLLCFQWGVVYATDNGQRILATGKDMIKTQAVVVGSCWDFINTVYNRAGFPQKQRQTIHKGNKSGPYAPTSKIRPGDWLYFINHSYNGVGHSGIFVRWVDKTKRIAEVISYVGQSRKAPGRYANYRLTHVYNIIRPSGNAVAHSPAKSKASSPKRPSSKPSNSYALQLNAEKCASPAGKRILRTGRQMVSSREVIRGTSVNYLDKLFQRAGFPYSRRQPILQGQKNRGPYASTGQIQVGDWVCYINHSYNRSAHCGVFVRWLNKARKQGEILSYGGENRRAPGRYRAYKLSHVYQIIRAIVNRQSKAKTQKTKAKKAKTQKNKKTKTQKTPPKSSASASVLKVGRQMLANRTIIKGSSAGYIDAIYRQAGYPQSKRRVLFRGDRSRGPYAVASQLKSGDWVYFVNHSYHEQPHCGIFIRWINRNQRQAEILSYGGENRLAPGRMRNYDLSHIYKIIRPQ